MKFLFVSGTTTGGSGRSQRDLANSLRTRGHDVTFLVNDKRSARFARWLYEVLSDTTVKLSRVPGIGVLRWFRDRIQSDTDETLLDGLPHLTTALPQNALPGALARIQPDIVVASSVERWAWRLIRETCQSKGIPTILYVREESSLPHVSPHTLPDALVANTPALADALRAQGYQCAMIPSLVDLSSTATSSSRQTALVINPIAIKGADLIWDIARLAPEIPFVIQEAWALPPDELEDVHAHVEALDNVTFRPAGPPGPTLYGDARVLLAPYRVNSRPRVVLEAQANGIPVLASPLPALVDAVGPGGMIIPPTEPLAWVEALRTLWHDEDFYQQLSDSATRHAERPDVQPGTVTERFEALTKTLMAPFPREAA